MKQSEKKEPERKLTKKEMDIAYEGFMTGRIYNEGGEKEGPAEIYKKLIDNCIRAKYRKI